MGYQEFPIPKIHKDKCTKCLDCIDACYAGVFQKVGDEVQVANPLNCTLCNYCIDFCEPGAITIKKDSNKIIFSFTTTGGKGPSTVLAEAGNILLSKIDEFKKSLEILTEEKEK